MQPVEAVPNSKVLLLAKWTEAANFPAFISRQSDTSADCVLQLL
jgi:hypothetical protein